ncbi:MAG: CDP-glucose 4,6-dehydratase [Gemmatimonadetes bacterium]|nr:CDP-glucose 4,6-dehydratase [Gemmatimonadota bacterium]
MDQRRVLRLRAGSPGAAGRRCHDPGAGTARGAGREGRAARLPPRGLLAAHGHPAREASPGAAVVRGHRSLEARVVTHRLAKFFDGRSVLVTGHTGFKGAWLAAWLRRLGARVSGFALPPEAGRPALFDELDLASRVSSHLGDLRDREAVAAALGAEQPEIVFHLAAQSLVRRSYRDPLETWSTNIMGTAHLLEAVRATPSVRTVVVVTSDKCYENREWDLAYRESDALGGHDPYSASKGAQEILATSYRRSFLDGRDPRTGLATARAGNVIGGGDWSEDRLLPDIVRALTAGEAVPIRRPGAVRPWQHVLEPLAGYLALAMHLRGDPETFGNAWNFGPDPSGSGTVREVVEQALESWGSGSWTDLSSRDDGPHEAGLLRLDCSRAMTRLDWRPVLDRGRAVDWTLSWYRDRAGSESFDAASAIDAQIAAYEEAATAAGAGWAMPAR